LNDDGAATLDPLLPPNEEKDKEPDADGDYHSSDHSTRDSANIGSLGNAS
jgi:hypothetical protein